MSKKDAPATQRNREPILNVLQFLLNKEGTLLKPRGEQGSVLEVASGTGQHAAFFAASLPHLIWQPSERSAEAFASIEAWGNELADENWRPPIEVDAQNSPWAVDRFDAIFNANMIHISPWETCLGLLRGAQAHLVPDGLLILYGPFQLAGRHTSASNEAFDRSLKDRDPRWGIRDLDEVVAAAKRVRLSFVGRVPMPANNQIVVFRQE